MAKRDRRKERRDPGSQLTGIARLVGGAVILLGVLFALLLILMGARPLAAQGLAEFDYEDLSLRGIMLDVGTAFPSGIERTASIGARLDLGYLGPGVRVTVNANRWSSRLLRSEVRRLEEQLEDLMEEQTGSRPSFDLGRITMSDLALGTDAHVVFRVPGGLLSYTGLGFTLHVLRGGGDAIEGTFVEEFLDGVRGGINAHAGLELPLNDRLRVVGESRYEMVQNVSYLQLRLGGQLMFGPPLPAERR
jgi:hypothetical protein